MTPDWKTMAGLEDHVLGMIAEARAEERTECERIVLAVQEQARVEWGGGGDRWAEVKSYTDEILRQIKLREGGQ